jgi:hypothetical protein
VQALARLLEENGQRQAARREYERLAALCSRADPRLPELAEARQALARLVQGVDRLEQVKKIGSPGARAAIPIAKWSADCAALSSGVPPASRATARRR